MSAAEIGATMSEYGGNVSAGGGTFGVAKIDTQPIQDLARYTFLYNKSEYDQRQKDVEAAAKEIADGTSYDLTTGIDKDAKVLQQKYDKLTNFMRDNPDALNYRNKEKWAEYRKLRNEMDNDVQGAKVRNVMYALREKEIANEPNEARKKLLRDDLDREIKETDIRTPIKHSQKYQDNEIVIPPASALTFDVTQTGANGIAVRDYKVFDLSKARRNGDVFSLGIDDIDPTTEQGKRDAISRKTNFWVQGAEVYNSILNAKQDGSDDFKYKRKVTAPDGTVTYEIDESKLGKQARNLVNLAKETNEYIVKTRAKIKEGAFRDKFDKPITFGSGALDENDYQEINYKDGISPEELAVIAQYAQWAGDTYSTKVTQTDNAIQLGAQALTRRGQDLDFKVAWKNAETARINALKKDNGGDGTGKPNPNLQTPAILFGEHIDRLKTVFAKDPKTTSLTVGFAALDEKTKLATGVTENEKIKYHRDGSYEITDESGKTLRVGTIEDLKQGFMNAVKTGLDPKGTQTEGFQREAEEGFDQVFGTRSGSMIFDNWDKGTTKSSSTSGKQIKESDIASKAAASGYTTAEYKELLIKNGIKIIK